MLGLARSGAKSGNQALETVLSPPSWRLRTPGLGSTAQEHFPANISRELRAPRHGLIRAPKCSVKRL